MDWNHKKVLVTGAGGFIGSHLAERLVSLGAVVRALVHYNSRGKWGWLEKSSARDSMEVIAGDVRDSFCIREAMRDVDIVYHLAALIAIPHSYHAPQSYVQTNVEGTLNVLQAARDCGTGLVVHTSTSEVYGSAQYVPIDEKHPLQGQSPYSASKIGADKMAESFHLSFGLPVVTLRPFNTYGPRQSARAVIPTIVTQAIGGKEIRLGNLLPTRDLNFVDDTVSAYVKVGGSPAAVGQVINAGSGQEISIGDLAVAILKVVGKDLPVVSEDARVRPKGSEVERLCADNARARELLGWEPEHTLERGLTKTIEWIEKNIEEYKIGTYAI